MDIKVGQKIKVRAFNEEILERVVVGLDGEVVIITTKEEKKRALLEGRPPLVVGFKTEYIVSD